jgi:DNA-binding MarR family transcriptional regulator
VFEDPKDLEEMIRRMRAHWDRGNVDAGATTVRLYRARDKLYANARAVMEQYDLNPGEYDTLASLRKMGPPYEGTPTFICHANVVSSGGLTKVLNSLEKRGYITRKPNADDLRSRVVKLTKKGLKLIEDALAEMLARQEKTLAAALAKKEREELDRLLIKLNAKVE